MECALGYSRLAVTSLLRFARIWLEDVIMIFIVINNANAHSVECLEPVISITIVSSNLFPECSARRAI